MVSQAYDAVEHDEAEHDPEDFPVDPVAGEVVGVVGNEGEVVALEFEEDEPVAGHDEQEVEHGEAPD